VKRIVEGYETGGEAVMKRNMNRRDFLGQACGSLAGLSALGMMQRAAAAEQPPNIVFILIDDLGWADLPCYGNRFHETPNIDRLAAEGMRFTDAYAACPVCSPTRASILSGQYPARVGVTDFIAGHYRPYAKLLDPRNRQQYMPLEIETVAESLKQAGYANGAFGKWHLGGREYFPDKQGFDEMLVTAGRHFGFRTWPETEVEEDAYQAERITDAAVDFIGRHKEEPFFVYLSHYIVHIPLEARQELIRKYEEKEKPDTGVNNPVYAAMVEHADRSVGRVLDTLEEQGLTENTMVVFFSDNGGLRKRYDGEGPIVTTNAPLRDEKGSLYEGGIREPMIVRWPGAAEAGSTCDTPVTSVDFYRTFLDIAGVRRPMDQVLDGESIVPVLKGGEGDKDRPLYWHYPHYHHTAPAGAIRRGPWKLIEYFEDGHAELYNLEEDIGEKHDLAAAKPDLAAELRQQLKGWRDGVGAAMPRPNPDYDPARQAEWAHPKNAPAHHPGR
jgi:arylsulfatase A